MALSSLPILLLCMCLLLHFNSNHNSSLVSPCVSLAMNSMAKSLPQILLSRDRWMQMPVHRARQGLNRGNCWIQQLNQSLVTDVSLSLSFSFKCLASHQSPVTLSLGHRVQEWLLLLPQQSVFNLTSQVICASTTFFVTKGDSSVWPWKVLNWQMGH